MSLSPSNRGRERRRSNSCRRRSGSVQQSIVPAPTRFHEHRIDQSAIAAIKNRKVREFYEVSLLFSLMLDYG
jgi:hypothetical protein